MGGTVAKVNRLFETRWAQAGLAPAVQAPHLQILSREFRQGRRGQVAATQHQEMVARALRMMDSEQVQAFEIKEESRGLRDLYGDTDFGRGCLVASHSLHGFW